MTEAFVFVMSCGWQRVFHRIHRRQHAFTDDTGMSKHRLSPYNAYYHNWHTLNFTTSDSSLFARWVFSVEAGFEYPTRKVCCIAITMHMLPWPTQVHNPNGTLIGSAIFAQLTAECRRACPGMTFPKNCPFAWGSAHCRQSLYFTMRAPFLPKLPLPIGWSGPHLKHIPWARPRSQPKQHLDRFRRFCTAHSRVSLKRTTDRRLVFHH